jgi:hypothetical protein
LHDETTDAEKEQYSPLAWVTRECKGWGAWDWKGKNGEGDESTPDGEIIYGYERVGTLTYPVERLALLFPYGL